MKRIYFAVIFLLFSFAVGIFEYASITTNTDNYLSSVSEIGSLVKNNKIKEAERLSKETANKFNKFSKSFLYCFYKHDDLEEIAEKMYTVEDLLDDKNIEDYHKESHLINEKLLFIKEKEQITIQNIL